MPILFTALLLAAAQDAPPEARRLAKPLQPHNPASWLTDRDYPRTALRLRMQGSTGFRLDIAADGKVTGCTVVATSGSELLDTTTCKLLLRRAHFSPAEDSRGNRIPATYTSRFRWSLPR
ncbi:MAG: energy transducer TonB [Pseudomonadota bacterium]